MIKYIRKNILHPFLILDILTIICLFLLPYYLFNGNLFIGGDDSKLYYIYPWEYIKNISFFSWLRISSLGVNGVPQFSLPFLLMWSILEKSIGSKTVIDYLAYSMPLILGFIYFKKFIAELIITTTTNKNYRLEFYIGSLFYILSPILIVNQLSVFLTPVWLIGLFPIGLFYLAKYIKSSKLIYIFFNIIWCTVFSITLFTVPWILGFLIPLSLGFIFTSVLYTKNEIIMFLVRSLRFLVLLGISQSFWIIPIFIAIVGSLFTTSSLLSSPVYFNTFKPTVLSTASGNIIYPLLNLFHRQIAFDFNWYLKQVYLNYYDKTFVLNLVFLVVIFIGILFYKQYLKKKEKRFFLSFLVAFFISLFLFTVNIGPLKNLFLAFGNIPGFVMFRNFYDKFAFGYVFLYSVIFVFSLVVIKRMNIKKYYFLVGLILIIIIINFIPLEKVVNQPLWTTKNVYGNATFPKEYLDFMTQIKTIVQPSDNILSLPLNIGSYSIIMNENSRVYAGSSRVNLFTNSNDFSGDLSFAAAETARLYKYIRERDYKQVVTFLKRYNINYIFVTNNLPQEIKKSFLFYNGILKYQDKKFIDNVTRSRMLISKNGNYALYDLKNKNVLLDSKGLYFMKINSTKFKLYIKNIKSAQALTFLDSFDNDWRLYLVQNPQKLWCNPSNRSLGIVECSYENKLVEGEELVYLYKKSIFDQTHREFNGLTNQWIIDPKIIKTQYDKSFYKENKDGTIDIELILYFKQQSYFYLGTVVTGTFLLLVVIYFLKQKKNEKNS
jgi:hypothetical protein